MKWARRVSTVVVFLIALADPLRAATIYVSPAGGGDGSIGSPTDLQTALDAAAASASDDVIRLQRGTYPAAATFTYAARGTDTSSLLLSGGWSPGRAEQWPLQPELTVLHGQGARRVLKITATGAGVNSTVRLENLTVQGGYTDAYAAPPGDTGNGAGISAMNLDGARLRLVMEQCDVLDNETAHNSSVGGGLYLTCEAALRNVKFQGNQTKYIGGALHATYAPPYTQSLAPTIEECKFQANGAYNAVAHNYGGAHVFTNVAPVFRRTSFIGRFGGVSLGGSGVLSHNGGYPTFHNCFFSANVSDFYGGAIQFWDGGGEIAGCLIQYNTAGASGDGAGGALAMYDPTPESPRSVTVVNSTFVQNVTAGFQGNGGAIHNRVSVLTVANSIFWDNGTAADKGGSYALIDETGKATVDFSDVQGGLGAGFSGSHNITLPPGTSWDFPYYLQADSPCVDAGSNAAVPDYLIADYEGAPRIFGGKDPAVPIVDMGWYEYYDGNLSITSPKPWTIWLNDGRTKQIAWTCTKITGNLRFSLWRGDPLLGGTQVPRTAASVPCAAGGYGWKIPLTLPDRDDYTLLLQSIDLPAVSASSRVATQHLQVKFPNRGNLYQGGGYAITWGSGGLTGALVRIELYKKDRRVLTIAPGAPNTGRYAWKVPFTLDPSYDYRIKVSTTSPRVASDFSNSSVSILPAVTLTAPSGGQVWQRGTVQKITWSYRNDPGTAVRLELYRGGAFDRTIAASVPIGARGTGSYRWRIPAGLEAGVNYTVKVRSTAWPRCFDFSDYSFRITE